MHALKIFELRMKSIAERELEALRTLKHENIVAFLGQETDLTTKRPVAVMEYCDKSLFDSLCEPANSRGLPEDEYIRFFRHTVEGLKHLREHGFLHRDIKPGNILVVQDETGRNIYKLSDFGTAKPILETEAFQSLVGTEEYLHPNIFKAAFIDKAMLREFDSAADLWSLGATMYHAATGKVPFQPYGGRNDRTLMFRMIAQKEFGVIAGQQKTYNGDITWYKDLPDTCLLSKWLRQVLTEMLARLLEIDPRKAMTFEAFFVAANDILTRHIVHVFSTSSARHIRLYMRPDSIYEEVQEEIFIETNIPAKDQYLHYEECLLKDVVKHNTPLRCYPRLSSNTPLVLIRRSGLEECIMPEESNFWYLEKDKDYEPLEFSVGTKFLSEDFRVAKAICDTIAHKQQLINLCCLTQQLFEKTISRTERWKEILVSCNLKTEVELYRDRVKDIRHIHSAIKGNSGVMCLTPDVTLEDLKYRAASCGSQLKKVQEMVTDDSYQMYRDSCIDQHRCQKRIEIMLDRAIEKKKLFQTRKKQKSLSFHEDQLHKFDRTILLRLLKDATQLWETHCQKKLSDIHSHFLTWHKQFAELQDQIERLQKLLKEMRSAIKNYTRNLKVGHNTDSMLSPPPSLDGASLGMEDVIKQLDRVKYGQQEIKNIAEETASFNKQSMDLVSGELDTLTLQDSEQNDGE